MLRDYRTVRAIASVIANAGEYAMQAYRAQRVTDEPHITDRLMGAIEIAVNNSDPALLSTLALPVVDRVKIARDDVGEDYELPALAEHGSQRLSWHAMTLRAGPKSAAHEKRFGADVLGVLTVSTPTYNVAKGFLAQAKRAEPGEPFSGAEWARLQKQCELMLATTPDSFAMVYSKARGIRIISAEAVAGYSGRDIFALYDNGLQSFFEKHIESFIGDRRLSEPRIETLEKLRQATAIDQRPSAHVLHLKATPSE